MVSYKFITYLTVKMYSIGGLAKIPMQVLIYTPESL